MRWPCECPKSGAGQGVRSAVWQAKQATSDAAMRPSSGIPEGLPLERATHGHFMCEQTLSQPRNALTLGGKMELLIGFVATLFISLLIFRK
jgi:hypothetical protein